MRALLVFSLLCSSATAAPVLVTKDNYKSSADSPFDLSGGGFFLEDFEDGVVNTPGLTIHDPEFNPPWYNIVGPGDGGVSVETGGKSVRPMFSHADLLSGFNFSELNLSFSAQTLAGLPSRVGFVATDLNVTPLDLVLNVYGADGSLAGSLTAPYHASRFYGVTLSAGISSVDVRVEAPLAQFPFYQLDHVQYGAAVPEPSSVLLALLGFGVAFFRRVARIVLFFLPTALLSVLTGANPSSFALTIAGWSKSNNYEVLPGKGRDGVVLIQGLGKNWGSGTLLPSRRHLLTAYHVTGAGPVDVYFQLPTSPKHVTGTVNRKSDSDLSLVTLSETMPLSVDAYEIYRGSDEIGKAGQLIGFGRGGNGTNGATEPIGTKREGTNRIEDYDTPSQTSFRMDFDDGSGTYNTLASAPKGSDLGTGATEAQAATTDSGGPLLIDGKIAGVAYSYDAIVSTPDFSFGWISKHMRMSIHQGFYDQFVPPVVNSVIMSRQSAPYNAYAVPSGNGNQLRTVPVGGANQILIALSEDVLLPTTVSVVGKESGTTYPITTSSPTPRLLIININAPIQRMVSGVATPGDKLTITVGGVKKLGSLGANLDGNWENPDNLGDTTTNNAGKTISRYPSGNGLIGVSFVFRVIVQPGDFDANNIVDLTDFGTQKASMGKANPTYAEGDSDGDGDIDLTDFGALKANMNVDWTSW